MIVTGQSKAVGKWLSGKLGQDFVEPFEAFGIINSKGCRVGAVLFNDYSDFNIEVTCYCPVNFSRGVQKQILSYCFDTLKCERMTARTRAGNTHVRKFLENSGFKQEGVLRRWYGGEDAILYGLLRNEHRLLR